MFNKKHSPEESFEDDEVVDVTRQKAGPLMRYFVIGVLVVMIVAAVAWKVVERHTGIETDLAFLAVITVGAIIMKFLRLT